MKSSSCMRNSCVLLAYVILMSAALHAEGTVCAGDLWQRFTPKAREAFVDGYVLGSDIGHSEGCHQGTKGWPGRAKLDIADDPTMKCLEQLPDFSKGADYFVKAISEFYKRYPGDRNISVTDVLDQLAKGLTLEQVHNYPFMRRTAALR